MSVHMPDFGQKQYTRLSFPVTKDKERVVTEQGSAWPCFSLAGYRICKKWRRDSRVRPARWPRPSRDRLVNTSISRPDSQKTNGSFSPTQNLVVPYTCTIEFCHETIRKTSTPTITLAFFGDSVLLDLPVMTSPVCRISSWHPVGHAHFCNWSGVYCIIGSE